MKLFGTDGNHVPDGVYAAHLLSITEREPREGGKAQNPFNYWTFLVFTNEFPEGVEHPATSSRSFGSKSKMRRWIEAALGRTIRPSDVLDTDDILPLPCQVVIKADPGTGFSRIVDVLKAKPDQGQAEGVEL